MGETFISHGRHKDARLRVIYDNGTESDILMRSLQRALNKDETGRRITDPIAGPLFTDEPMPGAEASEPFIFAVVNRIMNLSQKIVI